MIFEQDIARLSKTYQDQARSRSRSKNTMKQSKNNGGECALILNKENWDIYKRVC